jgi:hypothetical protein
MNKKTMVCTGLFVYRGYELRGDDNMLKRQWLAAFIIFTAFYITSKYFRGVWEYIDPQVAIAWNSVAVLFFAFMIVCFILLTLEEEKW